VEAQNDKWRLNEDKDEAEAAQPPPAQKKRRLHELLHVLRAQARVDGDQAVALIRELLVRLDMFLVLCPDKDFSAMRRLALDLTSLNFKARLCTKQGECVFLEDLHAAFEGASTAEKCRIALDDFDTVATYMLELGDKDVLPAAHGVLKRGIEDAEKARSNVGQNSDASDYIKLATVRLLCRLNELYGRYRYTPPDEDFSGPVEQKKLLDEALQHLEEVQARSQGQTEAPQALREAVTLQKASVFEGMGYIFLFGAADVSESDPKKRSPHFWFQCALDLLDPSAEKIGHAASDSENPSWVSEVEFESDDVAALETSNIRLLADVLNAIGTAFEQSYRSGGRASEDLYRRAHWAYTQSEKVGKQLHNNDENIARSLMSLGVLIQDKEEENAKQKLEASVELYTKALGEKHQRTQNAKARLNEIASKLNEVALPNE